MQIIFRPTSPSSPRTKEDLQALLTQEGVGWDSQDQAGLLWDQAGNPVWATATSGFMYIVQPDGLVVYFGAQNGFRAQNLIPPDWKVRACNEEEGVDWIDLLHEGVEILGVSGSYGSFDGPDALREYSRVKREWVIAHESDPRLNPGTQIRYSAVLAALYQAAHPR